MKDILKRLTSFILIVSFIITYLPNIKVFGASQNFKSKLEVNSLENNRYKLIFSWKKANDKSPTGGTLQGYRIYYRNATKSEQYPDFSSQNNIDYQGDENEILRYDLDLELDKGSFYQFKIVPVYKENEFTADGTPISVDKPGSIISEFLFMTEIEVKAIGENDLDKMKVSWTLPTIDGNQFFTAYEINFTEISQDKKLNFENIESKIVNKDELTIDNKTASYVVSRSDFKVGSIYAVKVEPLYQDTKRDSLINTTVTIQNGNTINENIFSTIPERTKLFIYDKAYIKPPLNINPFSITHINLVWPKLSGSSVGEQIQNLKIIKTSKDENGEEAINIIKTLQGETARTITSERVPIPEEKVAIYKFFVEFKNVSYQDENGRIVNFDLTMESQEATYKNEDDNFSPYRPTIYNIEDNREIPFNLNITWEAFLRKAFKETEVEDPKYGKYLDKNVTYKIWVTDDKANFNFMTDEMATIIDGNTLSVTNIDNVPYFNTTLNNYYYKNDLGEFIQEEFIENKIYYIKISAIRNETGEKSLDAYGAHYIIPINKIPTNANMLSKPPLRIKKENGVEAITSNTIGIEWDEQWFEVYNDQKWYSKVGLVDGKLVFGDVVKDKDNILYKNRVINEDGTLNYNVTKNKIIKELSSYIDIPVIRLIDLNGANYKIHTVDFSVISKFGYEKYVKEISNNPEKYNWKDINPSGETTLDYIVNTVENVAGTMKPASSYVIFLRPYNNLNGNNLLAYFPNYISATTLNTEKPIDIVPIVPILHPVSSTDTTITVKWEYVQELNYELKFSEKFSDYPDGGIIINSEDIKKNGELKDENGKVYMYFTIENMFPESSYFIWIRSIANKEQGESVFSSWSNPIEMNTKELQGPYAPKGLGIASSKNVNLYNKDSNTNYTPSSDTYLIIQWLRHSGDLTTEIAPKGTDNDNVQFLYSDNIEKNSYMVKFNKLDINKRYYIRAKTRLIATKDTDGKLKKSYTYVVQISLDKDYKDIIEIEVPVDTDITNNKNNTIIKESDWSYIEIITEKSKGDYDGDKNPDMYPLPDKDFELYYDGGSKSLIYRLRSNQLDSKGNRDNNVDERFISRLIANRVYIHEVDISHYNNREINNRLVELPYSIIKAFDERKIELKIKADNFIVTIPYKAIINDEVKNMKDLNNSTKIVITITENFIDNSNNSYISKPQGIDIKVSNNSNSININKFQKPLKANMVINKNINKTYDNICTYVNYSGLEGWIPVDYQYNNLDNLVSFEIYKPAVYSVALKDKPLSVLGYGETKENMLRVTNKLDIMDLGVYNENDYIHANQFNQIIASVIKGDKSVLMNKQLSKDNFDALGRAKILVSGSIVSREAGISSLVKVYENKTGTPIKYFPSLDDTPYKDIKNSDSKYHNELLKAGELGFFRDLNANPKESLKMGDFMYILDIILQ